METTIELVEVGTKKSACGTTKTGRHLRQILTGHTEGVRTAWHIVRMETLSLVEVGTQKSVCGTQRSGRHLPHAQMDIQDGVYSVAYSPDGNTIASGSFDETIRLWDSQTPAATSAPSKGIRVGFIA